MRRRLLLQLPSEVLQLQHSSDILQVSELLRLFLRFSMLRNQESCSSDCNASLNVDFVEWHCHSFSIICMLTKQEHTCSIDHHDS